MLCTTSPGLRQIDGVIIRVISAAAGDATQVKPRLEEKRIEEDEDSFCRICMCTCLNCCVTNKPTPHINSVKCHGIVHALFKLHELRNTGNKRPIPGRRVI